MNNNEIQYYIKKHLCEGMEMYIPKVSFGGFNYYIRSDGYHVSFDLNKDQTGEVSIERAKDVIYKHYLRQIVKIEIIE